MITRKGFIASIGAALTGAASKAFSKEAPANLPVDPTPPTQKWYYPTLAQKWYYPTLDVNPAPVIPTSPVLLSKSESLDFFTVRTLDKLRNRRLARTRMSAWIPSVLCKPEDYKKRWDLLKGRQYEFRLGIDRDQGGWWRDPTGERLYERPVPWNIQDYMRQRRAGLVPRQVREWMANVWANRDIQGGF